MLFLLISYVPIECSKAAYYELKSMIPNVNVESQKSFIVDYCENVENKFKEMGFTLKTQKETEMGVIEKEIQEYIEHYNNNFVISAKLISKILFKNKWYINMFLPNLLDIGRITSSSQPSIMNEERKRFISALNEYGEIQEKAKISKFLWNMYVETHLSSNDEKQEEEITIIDSQEKKEKEKEKETDKQEEDNLMKIEMIKNKINKLFEDFIQYLSGKNIPKLKIGVFPVSSSINSPNKTREESTSSSLIELNIIAMCNKLKGLFDQYIHYKYNMSRKMIQGQPSTENSFIIGQLNINKSYMYYRKKDQQLCFSRTFSYDEMDFIENIIERLHELIHCITNETNKELMLLLYDQTEDIDEGLCDTLSRIISVMSSINYGFPDISVLKMDKDTVTNHVNFDEGGEINDTNFMKKYLNENNVYTMTEKSIVNNSFIIT
ncbi:hypothetical protein PIROE2DRAFT_6499 [Piromyces sp. E2]|nr:hypothetical protein PIROE2DRAFT_6499 [Piromyces sp. E2]|eukprot:OUM66351.1 hypothetical protein PIROE2DRAFT_6499 [Piromyces sp. E2]